MKHIVIENYKLNYKFHLLTLRAPDDNFSFTTGQFVVLKIKDSVFRCYSITSTPDKLPLWQIFVDITPQGPGTRYLAKVKAQDEIEVTRTAGVFSFHSIRSKSIIFAATGCGLAALKPMIEDYLKKKGTIGKVFLLWGLRHEKDIIFEDMLEKWQEHFPNFIYQIILSQPTAKWAGKRGHITEQIISLVKELSHNKTDIYLCGGTNFIEEAQQELETIGFPAGKIYFESCY